VRCGPDAAAISRVPMLTGKFAAGRIEEGAWKDWNAAVALINPARLLEMSADDAEKRAPISARFHRSSPYAYSDYTEPLTSLCDRRRTRVDGVVTQHTRSRRRHGHAYRMNSPVTSCQTTHASRRTSTPPVFIPAQVLLVQIATDVLKGPSVVALPYRACFERQKKYAMH